MKRTKNYVSSIIVVGTTTPVSITNSAARSSEPISASYKSIANQIRDVRTVQITNSIPKAFKTSNRVGILTTVIPKGSAFTSIYMQESVVITNAVETKLSGNLC